MYYRIRGTKPDLEKMTEIFKCNNEETKEEPETEETACIEEEKPQKDTETNTLCDTRPLYDTISGLSLFDEADTLFLKDSALVPKLYSSVDKILYPYVVKAVLQYDHMGSPIYSPLGVDKETIAHISSIVLDMAQKDMDEIEEICTEGSPYPMEFNRAELLRNIVNSLVICYIFDNRRPRYKAIERNFN